MVILQQNCAFHHFALCLFSTCPWLNLTNRPKSLKSLNKEQLINIINDQDIEKELMSKEITEMRQELHSMRDEKNSLKEELSSLKEEFIQ